MMPVSPSHAEERLHYVAEQLRQWRQSRPNVRGARIPAALWRDILQVAEVFSVPHVAKHLHLKPQALKRRRGETEAKPSSSSRFVEVTPAAGQAGPVAVEVQRPDGMRLRITYSESAPALAPLLQTFLEVR
jgi:hypothetical protein